MPEFRSTAEECAFYKRQYERIAYERDKLREMVDRYFLVIYTLQQQIPDERRKDVAQAVVKALEAE